MMNKCSLFEENQRLLRSSTPPSTASNPKPANPLIPHNRFLQHFNIILPSALQIPACSGILNKNFYKIFVLPYICYISPYMLHIAIYMLHIAIYATYRQICATYHHIYATYRHIYATYRHIYATYAIYLNFSPSSLIW